MKLTPTAKVAGGQLKYTDSAKGAIAVVRDKGLHNDADLLPVRDPFSNWIVFVVLDGKLQDETYLVKTQGKGSAERISLEGAIAYAPNKIKKLYGFKLGSR
jgi:hypothetical protein